MDKKDNTQVVELKKAPFEGEFADKAEELYKQYSDFLETDINRIRDPENDHRGLKSYSTDRRWEQFQNGDITFDQAVEYASKRALKSEQRLYQADIDLLKQYRDAPELKSIHIYVTWKRSNTWGLCPTAEVELTVEGGHIERYSGYASGCGYDKRSAAVSTALKNAAPLKKVLLRRQAELEAEGKMKQDENGYRHYPYGAGYNHIIPGLEGAVGIDCHLRVLEDAGFECVFERQPSGAQPDYYYLEKK